ncbi:MAG: TIM barrel protein [Gallionellaceae bacterium]
MNRIGFMQGRLSPQIDGKVQAFPWSNWQAEFSAAAAIGIPMMEWTLDHDRLYENPLMTAVGQAEIKELCLRHSFVIPSLTGDCFMQAPFWKAQGKDRVVLERDFLAVAEACAVVGISMIVVPLVDNGQLESAEQEDGLVAFLQDKANFFVEHNLKVVFESDFDPANLSRFIDRLDPALCGINYDIGNSAALGFNPADEIFAYGQRIINVHVKDRMLGGTTVPLGIGNADFETVFKELSRIRYAGNYILQTARAADSNHAKVLSRFRDMTAAWIANYGA